MSRPTNIGGSGFIPIPRDLSKYSYKIIIKDSGGTEYDVTEYVTTAQLHFLSTNGISSVNLTLDNNGGIYSNKFSASNSIDIYYGTGEKSNLSEVKLRCYIDNVYDSLTNRDGYGLIIEGRQIPKSSTNEHFVDSTTTLQFTSKNNIYCLAGDSGSSDSNGNKSNGILYNSGMVFRVYDNVSSSWKVWKDLTDVEKSTLISQSSYTSTHTNNYVDESRLEMSKNVVKEGSYDFYIEYSKSSDTTYFNLLPADSIANDSDFVTLGQNLLSLPRYGINTLKEHNRIKQTGYKDSNIILVRTANDTTRQNAIWIKSKTETDTSLTSNTNVKNRASATLSLEKQQSKSGTLSCLMLPTLKPSEKIRINIPYIVNSYVKIKGFTVTINSSGIEFNLELKEKRTSMSDLFKNSLKISKNSSTVDNLNGMSDFVLYDFSDTTGYTFTNSEVNEDTLTLSTGVSSGKVVTSNFELDNNASTVELRIKANNFWNCTYRVSLNKGVTWETVTLGSLLTVTNPGKDLMLEITLNKTDNGEIPTFEKVNIGVK